MWATLTATVSSALLYLDVWKISGNFLSIKTKQTSKKLLKFGLPLIGIPIINYLLSTSDQLIIKMFCGDYDAGLYAMGYKLSSAIFSLTTTFLITSSHHIIMDKYDNCDKCETESFLQNLALSYWTICLPLLICIFMFGKDIMMIMASEQYLDALMVFGLSSVGIVFGGYINYTNKAWELSNRSWIIALFSGSGALVNVILNIVLIPCYGYTVAAVTTIISYLTVIVFSYLLGRKIINPNPPICTTLKLLSCAASAFVVSALYVRLFPSGIIFSLLGCIIVVVVFAVVALLLLKKEFMKLFKQFSAQRG